MKNKQQQQNSTFQKPKKKKKKETCILSYVKQITSPGLIHDIGCLGLVHWDDPEGWDGVGGGFRMGKTCTPMVDSCQCMAKQI